MHTSFNRRTATKVKDGRVQRKNRHRPTGMLGYVLDRESPARGFAHVVTKRDVQSFIEIIPDWDLHSAKLRRIVLDRGGEGSDGWHKFYYHDETGIIWLCAWPKDLWIPLSIGYFAAHRAIFERLGVSFEEQKEDVLCRFTHSQARAFMLLHVFMHELGHHHDKLNQKHWAAYRGEDYAERFANRYFDQIWPAYVRVFGDPSRSE